MTPIDSHGKEVPSVDPGIHWNTDAMPVVSQEAGFTHLDTDQANKRFDSDNAEDLLETPARAAGLGAVSVLTPFVTAL